MDAAASPTLRDYLLLTLLCALLGASALLDRRTLTTHETTHCQNVVEMFASGDFLIPTYGGRPWLERPTPPHIMTGIPAILISDTRDSTAMRVGSIIAGWIAVLAFAWGVSAGIGRQLGVMSAAILATMREFAAYSVGPEADIFIASIVTVAGALFLRAEFAYPSLKASHFFGWRPWPVLFFFLLTGFTNNTKGPLFGTAFLATSMFVYFFAGRHWRDLTRYLWFWGWLFYFAIGSVWPYLAYQQYPDVADIWAHDYGKRLNQQYLVQPPWYYAVHVPWNLFPWTFPAIAGLVVTARRVFKERDKVWQFLWCWALVPPLVFSVFQGKHHHYMLNCIAPWGALSAMGAIALWKWGLTLPKWWKNPLFGTLVFGLGGAVAILLLKRKIPGPEWIPFVLAGGWTLVVFLTWLSLSRPQGKVAFVGFIGVIFLVHTVAYLHRTHYLNTYQKDLEFVHRVQETVPSKEPIYVLNEGHPLNASWLLYYIGPQTRLLHNETFLASDQILSPEIYLVGRETDIPRLLPYGQPTKLLQSEKTRSETQPADRYTLFKLRFHPFLKRYPEEPINGMQATGRAPGPELPRP
jgi:4-amino-4-deoxy-L-arabinose transferase-like glycosyltransferase